MLDCISVENMRQSDFQTIANWVPSLELMGRAAMGVYRAVTWEGPVGILAGSGNNGGDGYALACILHNAGIPCRVLTLSERLSPDSSVYAQKAKAVGVPILPFQPGTGMMEGDRTLVDCLLGTGFQGELRGNYRSAVEEINASQAKVVSVDINSGLNGDTGAAALAVYSDITVTIGYVKNGLITPNAGTYMQKLVCTDIGIRLDREENKICTEPEWQALCREQGISPQKSRIERLGQAYYRCPSWLDMAVLESMSAEGLYL